MNQSGVLVAVQICILKGKFTLEQNSNDCSRTDRPVVVNGAGFFPKVRNVRSEHRGRPDEPRQGPALWVAGILFLDGFFAFMFHPVGRISYIVTKQDYANGFLLTTLMDLSPFFAVLPKTCTVVISFVLHFIIRLISVRNLNLKEVIT